MINRALTNSKKVLDIGNGGIINYNFKNMEQLDCADLVISSKAVKKYEKYKQIKFFQADVLNLENIEDSTYDTVIISAVLHHLAGDNHKKTEENVEKALLNCMRVLKYGGKLLIVESTVVYWFEWIERILYPFMQTFFSMCKFGAVYQYSEQSLLRKIDKLGLKILISSKINIGKTIWIMKKKIPTVITPCGAVWIEIEK